MVDAGDAFELLARHHHGDLGALEEALNPRGQHGAHEDHAGHGTALEELEKGELLFRIVEGDAELTGVAFPGQHFRSPRRQAGNRFGIQLRDDDTHDVGAAGAETLGSGIRLIAGLFDGGANDPALFLAQRAAVEIAADGCRGDPRQLRQLLHGHRFHHLIQEM